MKAKEFIRRWGEGIKNLSAVQILHSKLVGIMGSIIGVIFGATFLVLNGHWYFIILFFFVVFLQCLEFISVRQQYIQAKNIEEALKNETNEIPSSGGILIGSTDNNTDEK